MDWQLAIRTGAMELQGLGAWLAFFAEFPRQVVNYVIGHSRAKTGSNRDMESRDMDPLGDMKLGIDFDLSVLVSYNPMGIIMTLSSRR
jgi:hypothetical protein